MTPYLILVSHHAVPCPAALEEEIGINVNDLVSYLSESSLPCLTATRL